MDKTKKWRVVGLWQVWDDLPDADAPSERPPEALMERPPEALMERLAGTFDHYPSKEEADRAMTAAGVTIRHAFEEREILGHVVVTDDKWQTLQKVGGWMPDGSRRHPPASRHPGRLSFEYGLAGETGPSRPNLLWAPTNERVGPRLEDVADRLRLIATRWGCRRSNARRCPSSKAGAASRAAAANDREATIARCDDAGSG